jgi:flagellar hook-associated protein 3 FlgL
MTDTDRLGWLALGRDPAGSDRAQLAVLQAAVLSLTGSGGGQVARARLHSELGASLLQIDQSLEQISGVRSEVGARLSSIDDIAATRDGRLADIATSKSQLSDLDYAEAVSRMNQQLVGLQAAQQSFSMISRLSLFQYL